jgi:hypothetical protein
MRSFLFYALFSTCGWVSTYAQDLYIAREGKDSNPGTLEAPLASFEAAQAEVRKRGGAVTVYVRAGTYRLSAPVIFSATDARTADAPVTYRSYPDEEVILSGARALPVRWEKYSENIVQAKVPAGLEIDQIFFEGKLKRMARFPNYDPQSSHFGGYSAEVLSPAKVATWKNPAGAFVHALHKHEWGGYHYRVKGKNKAGELELEGGYQNNRQMGMHDKYRFIEHVFEELDAEDEWYYDKAQGLLYFYHQEGKAPANGEVLVPVLSGLFEFRGSEKAPVTHISIEGFTVTQLKRTFMETREPLLRSDWAIFRGGAVVFEGTEHCGVRWMHFKELGGNAVFFSNYNRNSEVRGCHIEKIGGNGICFVGDPKAVRSPSFEYHASVPAEDLDPFRGPKTKNYPADCRAHDNLIHDVGQVEKQVAGVQISMASGIHVTHNTIYRLPRAGINISEGTWGGHEIAYNDVFDTVLETGDHGAFNSWGRDRFWLADRKKMDSLVEARPELILLDAVKITRIHHNRFRCDHGWDIDLDDGSSFYHIFNNLCLNGGLKLREGFHRLVDNNVLVNNSFHPHVWFKNSADVFRRNIVFQPYYPIQMDYWGQEVDNNFFLQGLAQARTYGTDRNSREGDPFFVNPVKGDFGLKEDSPALGLGIRSLPMDRFGVLSPWLQDVAEKVKLPLIQEIHHSGEKDSTVWLGAKLRNVSGLGDRSAYGLEDESGVIVESIGISSVLAKSGLQTGDVIRSLDGKAVRTWKELLQVYQGISWKGKAKLTLVRNQKSIELEVEGL